MHETESKNFIGNIDSILTEGSESKVTGWIVPLDYSISVEKLEFKLRNNDTGEISKAKWSLKPRKDVYDFLQGPLSFYSQ